VPRADHIDRVPVVVAGAGPAGLVLAATLARGGVGSLRSWGLEDEVRAGQLQTCWVGEPVSA
jgi:flavin-dependent dehydrogenase